MVDQLKKATKSDLPPSCRRFIKQAWRFKPQVREPCVYLLVRNTSSPLARGKGPHLIYVGRTEQAWTRIAAHVSSGKAFDYAIVFPLPKSLKGDASVVERALIKKLEPPLNQEWFKGHPLSSLEEEALSRLTADIDARRYLL